MLDLRRLNKISKPIGCSFLHLLDVATKINGAIIVGKLDMTGGYSQIRAQQSRYLVFTGPDHRRYQLEVLPQGHVNSPALFSNIVQDALAEIPHAMAYMDDIIIWGKSYEEFEIALLQTSKNLHPSASESTHKNARSV